MQEERGLLQEPGIHTWWLRLCDHWWIRITYAQQSRAILQFWESKQRDLFQWCSRRNPDTGNIRVEALRNPFVQLLAQVLGVAYLDAICWQGTWRWCTTIQAAQIWSLLSAHSLVLWEINLLFKLAEEGIDNLLVEQMELDELRRLNVKLTSGCYPLLVTSDP